MDLRFVERQSEEWRAGRALRHTLFFKAHGLPPTVLDDEQEAGADHLVAVNDGAVVAYGRLFDLGCGVFQISQMVVAPSRQSEGLGHRVLQALVCRARKAGATVITLKSRLTAEPFYAKAGFQRLGRPFPSKKTAVPHVNMTLKVSDSNEARGDSWLCCPTGSSGSDSAGRGVEKLPVMALSWTEGR